VKKDKEKNFKKKTKIFSLSSVLVVLKYLVTFISSLLFREEEEVKEEGEDEEHRRTTKPPHLFFSNNHETRTNATKVIVRLKDEDY
jgi:hypothetical protein